MSSTTQSLVLTSFDDTTALNWRIVNDGVMGGISSSSMEVLPEGIARFKGTVSLANNGGFASTRATLNSSPTKSLRAVKLRVKGDGQTYSFRLRTNDRFDDVSYKQDFVTDSSEWLEIELPLADFVPTWRGRRLRNVPPVTAPQIKQIGILISDKQAGPFELLLDWIILVH